MFERTKELAERIRLGADSFLELKELRMAGREIWQRNYFERALRDGKEYADASRYVMENPMRWEWDRENPRCEKETSAL